MKIDVNDKVDFVHLWQEGMKGWNGKMPERMVNDELEDSFWKEIVMRKPLDPKMDEHVIPLFTKLKTHITSSDHVLEIGPGWGNYTFSLLPNVNTLTCIDSSSHIIDYLQQVKNRKNANSLDLIHHKWEEWDNTTKYDVVFGINCFYRMYHIKPALKKMNETARRLAIIGMTTGPMRPHYLDLLKTTNLTINIPRRDYIHLLNILYELGIYAQCETIELQRTFTYHSYEELIKANTIKIREESYDRKPVENAIEKYSYYQDGKYYYPHQFHGVLLHWQPKNQ
ncbi:class I SAM-dependent methyltransferase [Alkalihalobacterium bogoriense]|uniref:class I SAM-dependent methyltransferase n=1 Tax=Alkalihalobacterium bogoriense TaxID=246272 RepID=UPI00047AF114|nr:methyltransferase domain-containing protein [Alkalihalobacterium bogoriense]